MVAFWATARMNCTSSEASKQLLTLEAHCDGWFTPITLAMGVCGKLYDC